MQPRKINKTQPILKKSMFLVTKLTLLDSGPVAEERERETLFAEKLEG